MKRGTKLYDLQGLKVDNGYRGIVISNGRMMLKRR